MPAANKSAGQRGNLSSASGRKQRSETSTPHGGSRAEPSHEADQMHKAGAKKAATKASASAKDMKAKAPAATKSNGPRPGTHGMKLGRKSKS